MCYHLCYPIFYYFSIRFVLICLFISIPTICILSIVVSVPSVPILIFSLFSSSTFTTFSSLYLIFPFFVSLISLSPVLNYCSFLFLFYVGMSLLLYTLIYSSNYSSSSSFQGQYNCPTLPNTTCMLASRNTFFIISLFSINFICISCRLPIHLTPSLTILSDAKYTCPTFPNGP